MKPDGTPERNYAADACTIAASFLDDLDDVDASTMCEVLEAQLSANDIENIRDEIHDLSDALRDRLEDHPDE